MQQPPDPDGGSMPAPTFPADEDADGDGLDNGTELELGTDPRYRDTDLDGVADDAEVGADSSAPLDADDDGVVDALENPAFDNDRDDVMDDTDSATGTQIVFGRFTPFAIANDGSDPTRIEIKLAGEAAESVTIGMSQTYYRTEWAPDELELDGTPIGDTPVELFDDGTHGDVIADDQVWSRGGLTTAMDIRAEFTRFSGQRCRVLFNELVITNGAGTETIPIGITDGVMPRIIPDFGFYLLVLDAPLARDPEPVADVGQRTDHVLAVNDPALALTLRKFLLHDVTVMSPALTIERDAVGHSLTSKVFDALDTDAEFVYAFTSEPVYTSLAGFYYGLANDVSGIGRAVEPPAAASGSAGRLRGIISFKIALDFPLNHETAHSWGVQLEPTLGTGDGHWGTAGTFGVLGGFDPATLVDHGDGTFTVGHFSEGGNDWLTTPFSPIELYLMGLVPPADIDPIPMLSDITVLSNDASGVTVSATETTVTIDDIVAAHGARMPAFPDARSDFAAVFAIFTDRELTAAELGFIDHIAADYEKPSIDYGFSFEEASGGRATMTTVLPSP